jgi:glycosyltransferase involved in cell wall biosynthesis
MLSVVIPLFNEAKSLNELIQELRAVAARNSFDMEIILVDDGSTDESWAEVTRLADSGEYVRGVRLRRNFGKAAALSAGFHDARGSFIVTLDADLQDDPREIPRFLKEMDKGFDVVSGWKKLRRDPWQRIVASRIFNRLVSRLTSVYLHDHNCGMKCYRREIFKEIRLYGELHRFVPVLAAARGWRVGEIVVNHRPRKFGYSKYGARRFIKGFLDLLTVKFLTGYGQRPQHMLGTIGLFSFLLGGGVLLLLTAWWVVSRFDVNPLNDIHLHERAVFYYAVTALLFGAQFMSVGFLAELVAARHGSDADTYSVAERTGKKLEGPP